MKVSTGVLALVMGGLGIIAAGAQVAPGGSVDPEPDPVLVVPTAHDGLPAPPPVRPPVIEAEQMAQELHQAGKSVLYGLYFDWGKAVLAPGSEMQLDAVTRLLEAEAELELLVVGHTDNSQSVELSLGLGKLRAEAIVGALAERGIDRERLTGIGVGMAAPLASNASEDGRARNRRIEVVVR